ncbi:hypothetical protein H072_11046 [Dactylellina haptotyla CBS 200.50]|uniref:OPT superfamily oligopeptide transporter n=1 Tax=Dactylellina haptotyla (strain CBS 200.50) TaxID=1284197 RepID=S7ZYL4_DACHA|nr:hypothetical protein H072_11046 [Dactylellina haptotyla CBS 200.50]
MADGTTPLEKARIDNISMDSKKNQFVISEHDDVAVGTVVELATSKDGYVDPEQAGLTADTTIETNLQLITKALDVSDDPTESPYTFRAFVVGLGIATFGAVIAEIFYFKPQTVTVNTIFLQIIAYVIGEVMALIPRWGRVGKFLNPGPWNQKEHVFATIMGSSAAVCALATEQLAVQALYYDQTPNPASAIFLLLSSQCLGYGFVGSMRKLFVYPTKMLWPTILPNASLFQTLHLNKAIAKKRLKVFWLVCGFIILWEMIPEYIFPLTAGISIFCLANQHSPVFTHLFGGSNGNEGLGLLSWCMDWQYVGTSSLVLPVNTLVNQLIGYIGCIILTIVAYYANVWNAKSFPFLAQALFSADGTLYNQTEILGANNEVDPEKLEAYGLPWFSTSNALSLLVFNIGVTAGIMHIICWNWNDIKDMFLWATPAGLKGIVTKLRSKDGLKFWKGSRSTEEFPGTEGDPHFAAMRAYKEAPTWWYTLILVIALILGVVCTYQQQTGLPWWGFLFSCFLSFVLLIFYAPIYGITGFYYQPVTAVQMIGGYMIPGKPVANMMFTLYGSNSMVQALSMLGDLKLSQYSKLPPQATFIAQVLGTCIGAIINWVMMNTIVKNQREILLSVQGSNIWSGQNIQSYNAQAIAWGGTSSKIFGRGGTYEMVPIGLALGIFVPLPFWVGHRYFPKLRLDYINTFIICTWLGWLSVGINSSLLPYFVFGFFAQFYLRRYRAVLFAKYNLIVTAAIGGGVQIIVFILTFAVFGGSGKSHDFPKWWGNNLDGNVDRCFRIETD